MVSYIAELEECFNAIPRDGSNVVKDDEYDDLNSIMLRAARGRDGDDSDDNGYELASKVDNTPFAEKVTEVADVIRKATPTPSLPVAVAPVAAGKPSVTSPEASNVPATVDVPMTVSAVPIKAAPMAEESERRIVEASKSKPVAGADTASVPEPRASKADDASSKSSNEVSGVAEAATLVDQRVMGEIGSNKLELSHKAADPDTSGATSDAIVWQLVSPNPQYEPFYAFKRSVLPFLLRGGRLPLERFEAEIAACKAVVETTYDLRSMYDKMKEIQSHRVRLTEIARRLNSQVFIWKRFMDVLRADAARMEGIKIGQADSASVRHLWDFDLYFEHLKALTASVEEQLKTLESGWNTLNRGVTIVLDAHGHERGLTRYEPSSQGMPPPAPGPKAPDLGSYDSLDTVVAPAPAAGVKKGRKSSDEALLLGSGNDDWGDDL